MHAPRPRDRRRSITLGMFLAAPWIGAASAEAELHAGASVVDVTPQQFPVFINGGMTARRGEPRDIKARALVLADGDTTVAIVVADSCMLPKDLVDGAKALAAERTGIPTDHMTISATHTHTAPSAMGALGTPADETYVPYLRLRLADAIAEAHGRLEPARVGYASTSAAEFTALRRWIVRADRVGTDPFGDATVRATMHAARDNLPNVTGESGPEDPSLAVISVRTPDGRPLALLANFSMHYFGGGPAADYFGSYCDSIEKHFASPDRIPVAIMSHGCSGDIWRVDYRTGERQEPFEAFVAGLVDRTTAAVAAIDEHRDADIAMAERRLPLAYRVPDAARLAWARGIAAALDGTLPTTQPEIYALEQIALHERRTTDVVVQAIRIGDIAITTTPTETFALTGLKLKRQSPSPRTMVIELANGGDGYIPPPEQHVLGGYTTWAARSAGLEVQAEPKIVEACLQLLEQVHQRPRRPLEPPDSPLARRIRALDPVCYYPLDEMSGPVARDAGARHRDAIFEDGVVFWLDGPDGPNLTAGPTVNRAAHFAGGRMRSRLPECDRDFTVSLWCWNGLSGEARETLGWLLSRDRPDGTTAAGMHLGVIRDGEETGRLALLLGATRHVGTTSVKRWQWHHVALVRDADRWHTYVDGKPDGTGTWAPEGAAGDVVFLGGRSDGADSWEGRLDEIAIFDRALDAATIAELAEPAAR